MRSCSSPLAPASPCRDGRDFGGRRCCSRRGCEGLAGRGPSVAVQEVMAAEDSLPEIVAVAAVEVRSVALASCLAWEARGRWWRGARGNRGAGEEEAACMGYCHRSRRGGDRHGGNDAKEGGRGRERGKVGVQAKFRASEAHGSFHNTSTFSAATWSRKVKGGCPECGGG